MAEFKISRLRYTWKGNWVTATEYIKDDVVKYGGSSWVCIRGHTAGTFSSDQTYLANPGDSAPSPAWIKMTDGRAFRGNWAAATLYNPNDIIKYAGNLYLVVTSFTSASIFDNNLSSMALYAQGVNWRGEWTVDTRYGVNDVVRYNGIVYICNTGHTSAGTLVAGLETNQASWTVYYNNVAYRGEYTALTRYRVNDLVTYNGSVLRCNTGFTSASTFNSIYWDLELDGNEFESDWSDTTYYGVGSVVRYGGYLYYGIKTSYGQIPENSIYQPTVDGPYWKIISKGINFRGAWSSTADYKTGDVVRRGGNLYIAITDHSEDGSTLDYLDTSNWDTITESSEFRGFWATSTTYAVNDVVVYLGTSYKCNTQHTSDDDNFPGDNGSGYFYWDIVVAALTDVGLSTPGDMLTYGLKREHVGDTSTLGSDRVPIGDQNQLFTVQNETDLFYKHHNQVARYFYVSREGIDSNTDPTRGLNSNRPWRTVKYACEQADDGFSGFTTIHVETGEYEETLPIIIPARTVVLGSELRSTTLKAAPAITTLIGDITYRTAALSRLSTIMPDLIQGSPLTKSAGNTEDQVILTEIDESEEEVPIDTGTESYAEIIDLISDIINYMNFHISSTGTEPTVTGTNTAETSTEYTNTILVLEANKDFIVAEVVAYLTSIFPLYNFDQNLYQRDFLRYIDAWIYDITYTGNYKSILEARYYRSMILGSENEDFFYLRDATGLRNCTLKGLEGTLNPPEVFNLYQRPTGGAYCSLDPGWGPNDTRTYINTRSPYIQGVTTIGTNCIGQKIDGSLHNGGNKSMVSNDFTQVLSDGIGAWVLNNGRAELVSVFTYYCTIGYLAENGGIIRGTNGNCSYGNYGAISDNVDFTEIPQTATVNNRNQEAIVASALAGEFTDQIQVLEFENAGQHYTTATATISGSGINAEVVFQDFRDNAIFEARLLDVLPSATFVGSIAGSVLTVTSVISGTIGNGFRITGIGINENTQIVSFGTGQGLTGTYNLNQSQTVASTTINGVTTNLISQYVGGGGYSIQQNNAQPHTTPGGDAYSITIASNDDNLESDYLGKRIIITGGTGTGQYGYITAYNTTTKVVNVSRESDDQPGWDNVIPGIPNAVPLDTTTRYRIEPRVTFSTPAYSAVEYDAGVISNWNIIKYGEIQSSYTGVSGDLGDATFDVSSAGVVYTVTLNDVGTYIYEVGDIITIEGDDVGGVDPFNNIIITVTAVNLGVITDFDYDGIPHSGKFVALADAGSTAIISADGESWTNAVLPSTGNWKCLAAGQNKFVAIRNNSNGAAVSLNAITWTATTMPASRQWNSVAYGDGVFLAVAGNNNSAAYSTDGTTWVSVTMPAAGDSSFSEWVDIAYGKGVFVVLSNTNNIVAHGQFDSNTNSWTWDWHIMDVVDDSSSKDWVSITYGNQKFVAISSTGDLAYSFDGEFWYPGEMPTLDGSTPHYWRTIEYGQGVYFAVGDTGSRDVGDDATTGATSFAASSEDGVSWTTRTLASQLEWRSVAFGSPFVPPGDSSLQPRTPMWVATANNSRFVNKIRCGCRAKGRVDIAAGVINRMKLFDTGSGYDDTATVTLTDPNNTSDATFELRLGDGVLTNPEWINRGIGYRTTSTIVSISGNGYADVIPEGKFLTLSNLAFYPGPGAQIIFAGNNTLYTLVNVQQELGSVNGGLSARVRISPEIKVRDKLEHDVAVSLRTRYSQVRITGHDFLDIGTGNFEETNYPELYSTGIFQPTPENEVYEEQGGRVFYTSTDQSGNFRTGELFAVEQATGIVTISADFFDLGGLTELRLGGIRVGGTGAVVREFSTDPLFTADSNNIVPTQRAIKAYLNNRLTVGGSEIATASFIAGLVRVGPDLINHTLSGTVVFPQRADFDTPQSGISGMMMAQGMFHRSFRV